MGCLRVGEQRKDVLGTAVVGGVGWLLLIGGRRWCSSPEMAIDRFPGHVEGFGDLGDGVFAFVVGALVPIPCVVGAGVLFAACRMTCCSATSMRTTVRW